MRGNAGRALGARRPAIGLAAAAVVGTVWLAGGASADGVYGTSAQDELVGMRGVELADGGGITGFGDYQTGFKVSWVIDFDDTTPGLWHYEYTFSGLERDLSHFVLDLSDDCLGEPGDPDCVSHARLDEVLIDLEDILFEDNDGIEGAVKFDTPTEGEVVVYSFDSNRAPVYGHLAVKSGGGPGRCPTPGSATAACNNGLFDEGSEGIVDFVARPNGVVPEPSTGALLAGGLAALGAARRRWRHS